MMTEASRPPSRGVATIYLVLFVMMAACLTIVVIAGAAFLIWNNEPIGNAASWIADVFAWIFAVAFSTAFVFSLIIQRRRAPLDASRRWTGADPGHH